MEVSLVMACSSVGFLVPAGAPVMPRRTGAASTKLVSADLRSEISWPTVSPIAARPNVGTATGRPTSLVMTYASPQIESIRSLRTPFVGSQWNVRPTVPVIESGSAYCSLDCCA